MQFLEEEKQLVLLFKEITTSKNLQQSVVRENFTNVFINSTAHNIFTPINGMKVIIELMAFEVARNSKAVEYVHMLKDCL